MKPNFPLKNMALHTLIEFQEAKFIFRYTDFIRTKDSNEEQLLDMDIEILDLQLDGMSGELNQIVQTTNDLTKTFLFEELKENIADFDLFAINKGKIKERIDKWNEERYRAFLRQIEKETEEYFQRPERKHYNHLQTYQIKSKIHPLLGWGTPQNDMIVHTNYNFYSIETLPELIDEQYLDEYYKFLNYALSKYQNIVRPLMKLYDEGKLTSTSKIEDTFYDRGVKWFKNNKVAAIIIIFIVGLTAILTLVNQVKDTTDRFIKNKGNKSSNDSISVKNEIVLPTSDSISNQIKDIRRNKVDTVNIK